MRLTNTLKKLFFAFTSCSIFCLNLADANPSLDIVSVVSQANDIKIANPSNKDIKLLGNCNKLIETQLVFNQAIKKQTNQLKRINSSYCELPLFELLPSTIQNLLENPPTSQLYSNCYALAASVSGISDVPEFMYSEDLFENSELCHKITNPKPGSVVRIKVSNGDSTSSPNFAYLDTHAFIYLSDTIRFSKFSQNQPIVIEFSDKAYQNISESPKATYSVETTKIEYYNCKNQNDNSNDQTRIDSDL